MMNLYLFSSTAIIGFNLIASISGLNSNASEAIAINRFKIATDRDVLIAQEQPNIVSTNGYDFQFTGCEAYSTDELGCSFVVVNNQSPRTLQLFTQRSKMINTEGNTLVGSLAVLGEEPPFCQTVCVMGDSEELPTKVPVKGRVIFKNLAAGETIQSNYIEFDFNRFKVPFTLNNSETEG